MSNDSSFSISRVISLFLVIMVIVGIFFPPLLLLAIFGIFIWLAIVFVIWIIKKGQ